MLFLFFSFVLTSSEFNAQAQVVKPKQKDAATIKSSSVKEESNQKKGTGEIESKTKLSESNSAYLSFLTLPFPVLTVANNKDLEAKLPEYFKEAIKIAKECNLYSLEEIHPENSKEWATKIAESQKQGTCYMSYEWAEFTEKISLNKIELIRALQIKLDNFTEIHAKYFFPIPLPSEKLEKENFKESALQYKKNLERYLHFYPFMGEAITDILKDEKYAEPTELINQLNQLTNNQTNQ